MNHKVGSYVFGAAVGLLAAWLSYQWITDPGRIEERQRQERAVLEARSVLLDTLGLDAPEVVDPMAPNRRAGKAYVYPLASGWEVSGYYRRNENDDWHDFLVTLDDDLSAVRVKVQDDDPALAAAAASDPRLDVLP